MTCSHCGSDNPAGKRFCGDCGSVLENRCPHCGADNPPNKRFCGDCGISFAAQPAHATDTAEARKVVTILFADLAGSTALHERLDPESVRAFMERYYAGMRAVITAHGGTLVKFLGDGVMAAFGVPHVAEDDAIRAVHAGGDMQRAFRSLARAHADIDLRVAINTGEVVVGVDDTDIVGDPVNVAARLQQEARPGDVVIGEMTRRLVAARVTLEPLGSFALRGRAEQVKAYRVVSLERPTGVAAAEFVGRDDEVERLTRGLRRRGGEAGDATRGAARLARPREVATDRRIRAAARRRGDRHRGAMRRGRRSDVRADCEGAARARRRRPLRTCEAAIEAMLPATETERARIAGGIAALLAGSSASPEETFFVVRRFLTGLAASKPVVLVIDDLHWAEPLLLDLVEHLIQWGGGVPLLVLVGARPELRDLRSVAGRRSVASSPTSSRSAASTPAAATRLAANVIGASDLPSAVAAKVLSTTEGNPLFVGELVRMLVDEGAIERQGDRWIIGANLAALEMPPTIHALLAARIERLRARGARGPGARIGRRPSLLAERRGGAARPGRQRPRCSARGAATRQS